MSVTYKSFKSFMLRDRTLIPTKIIEYQNNIIKNSCIIPYWQPFAMPTIFPFSQFIDNSRVARYGEVNAFINSLSMGAIREQLTPEVIQSSDLYSYDPNKLMANANEIHHMMDLEKFRTYILSLFTNAPIVEYTRFVFTEDPEIQQATRREGSFRLDGNYLERDKLNGNVKLNNFNDVIEKWINDPQFGSTRSTARYGLFTTLYVTPKVILEIICRLLIPNDLYQILSKTEAAMILAISTGKIAAPNDDPTSDREKWKVLSHIGFDVMSNTRYYLYEKTLVRERFPDIRNPEYVRSAFFLNENMFPLAELMVVEKFLQGGYGPPTVPAGAPGEVRFLRSCGINLKFYDKDSFKYDGSNVPDAYGYILHKKLGIQRPPLIPVAFNGEEASNLLDTCRWYSDDDLAEYYLPYWTENYGDYRKRSDLIGSISISYSDELMGWVGSTNKQTCANSDAISLTAGIPRERDLEEATEADLQNDPILSYGSWMHGARKRCFRVSELVASFENALENEETANFNDPDYVEPGRGRPPVIDPITLTALTRNFSRESMIRLRRTLDPHQPWGYLPPIPPITNSLEGQRLINTLIDLIDRIMDLRYPGQASISGNLVRDVLVPTTDKLIAKHPTWRNDLLIFFGWLFMFSMWMRFWKGPGHPFNISFDKTGATRCVPMQRDEHIIIEQSVYGGMLLDIENKDDELYKFIKTLPVYGYDWKSGNVGLGTTTIYQLLDDIQLGQMCMGFAGDITMATAYVYLTRLMKVPEDRLGDLLAYVVKLLRNREYLAIENRKQSLGEAIITTPAHRAWVNQGLDAIEVHEKLLHIGEPGISLPPFDFRKVGYNIHV